MPILTGEQIVIVLAEAAGRPVPESEFIPGLDICVSELSSSDSPAFTLRVTEGGEKREARLSEAESRHLAVLLGRLPAQDMTAPVNSFDGVVHQVVVVRAEQVLAFYWQNDDWRYGPDSLKEDWEGVAALADYVFRLTETR